MADTYSIRLIKRRDGEPISGIARDYLSNAGAYFDEALGGFVIGGEGGMPVSFAYFLPAHDLVVTHVTVDYNPEWFSSPSPAPVFEKLCMPWDGSEVRAEDGYSHPFVWFLAKTVNEGRPFIGYWTNGIWNVGDEYYSPNDVIGDSWTILATIGECVQMGETRIDIAHAARLDKQATRAIIEDQEGCALQVGIASGRLSRATVV